MLKQYMTFTQSRRAQELEEATAWSKHIFPAAEAGDSEKTMKHLVSLYGGVDVAAEEISLQLCAATVGMADTYMPLDHAALIMWLKKAAKVVSDTIKANCGTDNETSERALLELGQALKEAEKAAENGGYQLRRVRQATKLMNKIGDRQRERI